MDPNVTLRQLRAAVSDMAGDEFEFDASAVGDAAELFEALDEWLSNGGFLPEDWA